MSLNENEQSLRSMNSNVPTYVRFMNLAQCEVRVYWIDYNGHPVLYNTLLYKQHLDINTYVTHPWIFIDASSNERYLANGKSVYFPEPAKTNISLENGQQQIERHVVLIRKLNLYSLRELCIRVIRKHLTSDIQAYLLQLPQTLQHEIAMAMSKKVKVH